MNRLDTANLPLTGLQLIEASAGTGKTHAITTLYLRLLLETGLGVRDLLVVTFTHAATDELRARIRRRLVEAQSLLAAPADIAALEDLALRAVLQRQVDSGNAATARNKLAAMIAGIDEGAIFTIHSFCQRALRDHAFESGEMFDAELTDRQQDIVDAAVMDWWRRRFYPDPALAAFAAGSKRLATPAAAGQWLRDVLARDLDMLVPPCDPDALKRLASALKEQWIVERELLVDDLKTNKAVGRDQKKSLGLSRLSAAIDSLDLWSASAGELSPGPAAQVIAQTRLDSYITATAIKNGLTVPSSSFYRGLDDLFARLEALEFNLLAEARTEVLRRSDEQKRRANVLAFDDLIVRLRAALLAPGGERLAERIARQFPAAMIDEFQDTDPAQYDIFSRIYRDRAGTCLLMIGDPKQAIYSFRGADIFAYVRARHETAPAQRHTMTTNWRSAQALVDGIDALFSRLPEPFLMGEDVGWVNVDAAGRADAAPLLLLDGERPVPLQFWIPDDDQRYNKERFRDAAANAVATRCAELLTAAAAGNAHVDGRPLAPRDLAILVRSHKEASLVQDALLARGIGSALASQQSVFATPEAGDLAAVLDALLDPGNERALKRALLTPLWGLSANTLAETLANDAAWDALLEQAHDWHRLWTNRGFMPMFRRWLHAARVPANLLARPRGERALTNLLHLAELLQQASREYASPDELRQWLARGIAGDNTTAGEERQLRLESDENLVQVVTMHKSKGLEYPVVFLPFAGLGSVYDKVPNREDKPLYHDSGNDYRLLLDYVDPDGALPLAQREALAEDMRLLYVALTRAQHLCCVQWGAVPGFSALALLLLGEPGETIAQVRARHDAVCGPGGNRKTDASNDKVVAAIRRLEQQNPRSIAIVPPPAGDTRCTVAAADSDGWKSRVVERVLSRDWRVTSFSALASQSPERAETVPAVPVGNASEDAVDVVAANVATSDSVTTAVEDIAAFPRGTRAGHFFHELLEHLDFPQARGAYLEHVIRQQCLRHDIPARWVDVVAGAVADVLDTPLADGLLLRNLAVDRRSNECEFYYPLQNLDARALERVVPGLAGHDAQTPRFTFSTGGTTVTGLMHGYIDLVFEHAGRWYVADWKTNWLGPSPTHYDAAALGHAMRHHAYDLQYWVYTVALHRHLQQKLGDAYDYDRHVGGVYYFFLRGMRPANGLRTGVFFDRPSRAQVEALDALLRGERP